MSGFYKLKLVVLSSVLVTGLSFFPGFDAAAVSSSKPPPTTGGPPSGLAPNAALQDFVDGVNAQLSSSMSASYGGIDIQSNAVNIHVVGDSSAVSAVSGVVASVESQSPLSTLPNVAVTYVPANVSLAQLDQMENDLTTAVSQLTAQGIQLLSWGPNVITNNLDVSVYNLTSAGSSAIEAIVGSSDVNITSSNQPNAAMADRTTDSTPWFGGDLVNAPDGDCTSGFPMVDSNNVTYNLTAAHCGTGTITQNGQGYGVTYLSYQCSGCDGDAQLVTTYPGSAYGEVWTGGTDQSISEDTVAVGNSQFTGEKACNGGFFYQYDIDNGATPCGTITGINQCTQVPGVGTECGMNSASINSTTTIAVQGDSGGPVYNYEPNGLQALGMVVSGENCYQGPSYYACSTMFYVPQEVLEYIFRVNTLCLGGPC